MKRFSLYVRLLYGVIFLVTIAFVLLSPEEDALHFNNGLMLGKESTINLFIYPFLTFILGEAGIFWSKWYRKKTNLRSYPILLASEIKFIQILSLIVLIFILVMLHQVF